MKDEYKTKTESPSMGQVSNVHSSPLSMSTLFHILSPKSRPCLRRDSAANLTNGVLTTCGSLAKRSTARQRPSRNAKVAPKHCRPGAVGSQFGSSDDICSLRGLSDDSSGTVTTVTTASASGTPATSSALATFAASTPCSRWMSKK